MRAWLHSSKILAELCTSSAAARRKRRGCCARVVPWLYEAVHEAAVLKDETSLKSFLDILRDTQKNDKNCQKC